jgi:hypothetical protein
MSAVYPNFRENVLQGAYNLSTATVKVALLTSSYVYSSGHTNYGQLTAGLLTGGGRSTDKTLSSKTFTGGVFDAADPSTWTGIGAGQTISQFIVYIDSGSDATSFLIAQVDSGSGLPLSTAGGSVNLVFDNGANKIFAI